jgi:hypothetical protein
VRSKRIAYVLDVAISFHPDLAETALAVLGSCIDDLDRRAS